jgi:UDP-N-acetyl-D-mannosaminuronic acid transferase (WecB/TagA/CpsF family)
MVRRQAVGRSVERRVTGVSLGSYVALAQGRKLKIGFVGKKRELMNRSARQ